MITVYLLQSTIDVSPDAVHDGIVHGVGFRKERAPDREERADLGRLEDARIIDD